MHQAHYNNTVNCFCKGIKRCESLSDYGRLCVTAVGVDGGCVSFFRSFAYVTIYVFRHCGMTITMLDYRGFGIDMKVIAVLSALSL